MRTHRWIITGAALASIIAAGSCTKSNDAVTTAPPATAGTGVTTAPVTTPAVKTPGTTATTENGTSVRTTVGSTPATGATAPNQVAIVDFLFTPPTLEVKAGTEVIWVNQDGFDHWVLADDKTSFDSRAMAEGATFAHTFATPGTFPYFCNIHNQMKGTVVVS